MQGDALIDDGLEVKPKRTIEWKEIHSVQEVLSAIGLDLGDIPREVNDLNQLSAVDGFRPYFRQRLEFPPTKPGTMSYMVPRTRYWVDVKGIKDVKDDILWAAMVYLMVQNLSAAAAVGLVRKVRGITSRLSEDEAEVVAVIIGKSGGDPYKQPVSEQDVRDAYRDATVSITGLLDSLTDKGVITNRRDGMIQLQR
jgi:hypothetical protein